MIRCYGVLLLRCILAFTGRVHGFNLDEVILKDMMISMMTPASDVCPDNDDNTIISYTHTPSLSEWGSANSFREANNFLVQMTHTDSDPNRNWSIRFGKGGSIYSMRSGYGEAIPPQTKGRSPWVDEVTQAVSVDILQNTKCSGAEPSQCFFIHQAGTYFDDTTYMDEPFYSPNVARHCEGNTCIFATWGQLARNPTSFKSELLYFHQYRDCGHGVLEYIQMFVGYFGGSVTYMNLPWAGVRESSLPDLYLSTKSGIMADKEPSIPYWGKTGVLINLDETGGYSTFAQNSATVNGDNAALSYVHGVCDEFNDSSNKYFRAKGRMRYGKSRRDFIVFTINGQLKSTNPADIFYHRQFLINDKLGSIQSKASSLSTEAYGDMLTSSDFTGRTLEVYYEDSSHFGVAAASDRGQTSTTCDKGNVNCAGSTVPSNDLVPFFTIKCGSQIYFGPNRYHFNQSPDLNGKFRSYVCAGEAKGVVPEWKLIGYFKDGECDELSNAVYVPAFCAPTSPTESPTLSPTISPTKSPTSLPTTSPTKSPTSLPTISPTKLLTSSPTSSPTALSTSSPTISPTKSPTSPPTESPTSSPTESPTLSPTISPTKSPTSLPTTSPTKSSPSSRSPTVAPSFSPLCEEKSDDEFLAEIGSNPKVRTCKWLSTRSKTNQEKICQRKNELNGYKKPADVCKFTCGIRCPTTIMPSLSPTKACEEKFKGMFAYKLTTSGQQSRPCSFLIHLKKEKVKKVKKLCASGLSFENFGSAADICPNTCESCRPVQPTTSPTTSCIEKYDYTFFFKMRKDERSARTKTCAWLRQVRKKDPKKFERLCKRTDSYKFFKSARTTCLQTCDTCPNI